MLYTTRHLKTVTEWFDTTSANEYSNWEKEFDSFYDDEEDKLYLQFSVDIGYGNWDDVDDDYTRCLVCMNVEEDSEL